MKWLFIIILAILLLNNFTAGILATILFLLFYYGFKKSPEHEDEANKQRSIQPRQSSNLTAGDLADLVLLRLELQSLLKSGQIDSEQQAELTQRIDTLCRQHLAGFAAVPDNDLWQKRRAIAWDLLNHQAETPLGQPPWQSEPVKATEIKSDFSVPTKPEIPVTTSPLAIELNTPTVLTEPVQTVSTSLSKQQPATFAIDEEEHSSTFLHPVGSVSDSVTQQQASKPEPTLNQYAWKPHEPSRLERLLTTLSGWHSLAVPFLVQNIGWFIGIFCFIAGSAFLVHYSKGYASNLITFFAFFIFTLALLFGGYQLRRQRPELEVSSYVIFILSLLLIPLTTITATQLLISSEGGLKILSGLLVLVELGVFYFAVTLVAGLMDRSLQQGLPKFFLALTATQLLQVVLLSLPFWQLLAVMHLLIFALLSVSIYLFASQWLQSIFVDKHKIGCVAAGMLVYAAVVAFVFINVGNDIVLPAGYYGFFLMLLCMLLFFIDAQLKQWINQYAALSRFSFFVYGLSVLALCLVAQYQTACMLTLVLAIGLYAFIVWRYLTLTPLTILLVCYFWLYSLLVLQFFPDLPASWYFLASLPVLLSLYRAASWALNKRQSAYLALIVYRVLYSLLVLLTIWSLAQSEPSLSAMITALTAGILVYYALKSAPLAIFTPYSKIADAINRVSTKQNLLDSRWFYSLPLLAAVTVFYTPRLPLLTDEAQFSIGVLLLSAFWTYQGLSAFFKSYNASPTTRIEQRLNSGLLSVLVAVLPLWMLADDFQRIAPLLLAGIIILWLSYQLLIRWLFYLALILWVVAVLPLKAIYFPTPSGLVTVLMGLCLWCWLWFIERQETSDLIALRREHATQKIALLPNLRLLGGYQLPRPAVLFRDVIDTPLEQVMCLLWLLGMKTLFSRFMDNQCTYLWLVAVFLVLFSLLLIIRYSLIKLLPVPIALMLGAVLMMLLKFWALNTDELLLAAVIFALAVWQLVRVSLTRPFFIQLANTLNPSLHGESEQVAHITHHTAFFIALSGVILQLLNADTQSFTVLLTLMTTAGFLWLSDKTYPQLLVRYLVLGFSVLAGIELIALILYPAFAWQALTTNSYAALLFTLLSLAVGALSIPTNAYTKPAAHTAILLIFIGVFLQITHVIQITAVVGLLDYTVLFLAGFSLLLANAKLKSTVCTTIAFMILVLAVLWLENSIFHAQQPFSLWLGVQTFADLWLVLGLLSLAMTSLSQWLKATQKGDAYYLPPLNTVATLGFTWSLLGTLTLFFATAGQANLLACLLLVSLLTLFSLSKNRSGAAQSRGFASACLPTLTVFSLLPINLDGFSLQAVTALFGYALWCCASFILPRFNKRYSEWTITPDFFPWLGLLLVAFSGCWWQEFNIINVGVYCLELSIYCLLMLRYSNWAGFSWASAFTFTAAGIAFNFNELLPIILLLWSNLPLLLINFWQHKGEKLTQRWQWQLAPIAPAFEFTSKFIFISYLLIMSIALWIASVDDNSSHDITLVDSLPIGILLSLSFLHLLWLRFSALSLHSFIYALLLSLWTLYFTCLTTLFHSPLLLVIWSIILLGTHYACSKFRCAYHSEITKALDNRGENLYQFFFFSEITKALDNWLRLSVILATFSLLSLSNTLAELLLSLGAVICLSAVLGWRSSRSTWLVAACIEVLVFLHLYPFLLIDNADFYTLLPWYALQIMLFMCLSTGLLTRLASNPNASEHTELYTDGLHYASWLIALSLLELGAHGILVKYWITSGAPLPWLLPNAITALSTGLIISFIGIRHVRYLPDSKWLYGIVTLVGALIFYSRLVIFKTAEVSLWDTSLLIVFAYSLFFIQRLFPSKPLLNMALFMPVLVIFTVPLQLASPETSVALIATGLLYLLMRRHTQQKIPLYLALLAFNAGVYLWIPRLVDSSQLIQVYVIPAALSSLMLLHLHSRELKPSVLMGSRLAAISSIYACATADVFLSTGSQQLSVFILAMALSVAGILLGIALKTRAFLYAGVSFLLLNVLGQLRLPEQGFSKAIVLMVMGTVIISVMIWFNIKRVAILQRISAIQAEMQTWE